MQQVKARHHPELSRANQFKFRSARSSWVLQRVPSIFGVVRRNSILTIARGGGAQLSTPCPSKHGNFIFSGSNMSAKSDTDFAPTHSAFPSLTLQVELNCQKSHHMRMLFCKLITSLGQTPRICRSDSFSTKDLLRFFRLRVQRSACVDLLHADLSDNAQ